MNLESRRKWSQDAGSESEEDLSDMFPQINNTELRKSLETLKEYYNKNLHAWSLSNYCFRCHNIDFVIAYDSFRQEAHPQLKAPQISTFYDNSCFVDLKELGKRIQKQPVQIPGPSILPVPKNLNHLLNQIFQSYGYIPNLQRFLLFYPIYLEKHLLLEKNLFETGNIDNKIAYFLAICAAAEMGSPYILARMLKKFQRSGGDLQWLSAGKCPQKLKKILSLNRTMARAIWQINPQMIQDILSSQQYHWTQIQLTICIEIFAFTHQISTISLAVGLLPQEPNSSLINIEKIIKLKGDYDMKTYESSQNGEQLAVMIPIIQELQQQQNNDRKEQFKEEVRMSKRNLKKSLRRTQSVNEYMKQIGNELTKQDLYCAINKLLYPLLPPFQLMQKRRENIHPLVHYSDFNFKFMAHPILHSYNGSLADKFESLISYSEIMTRDNFGSEKVKSTKELRKAMRYYAQNLCGYTHHEYDFKNNVGAFLTIALKFYIRLLALSPMHINRQVIKEINHQFGQYQCFDLGHVAVLISCTKMSLQLTLTIQAFDI